MNRIPNRRQRRYPTPPRKGYFHALNALHAVDADERLRQQLEHARRVGDDAEARRIAQQLAEREVRS